MPAERSEVAIRPARADDAADIARIYNEGIEDRRATFQTRIQRAEDFAGRLEDTHDYPYLVAESDGAVAGWAGVKPYSDFPPYRPVAEAMLYVARDRRGRGIGTQLLHAIAAEAERAGFTKLLGKIFTDNDASMALVQRCGFREVGVHHRHGRLDGRWKDVLLVELLIGDAAEGRGDG